jgi:hypothetical protein
MRDASDLRVSPEDLDPRGWIAVDDGRHRIGTVSDLIVDTAVMKVRYVEIDPDDRGDTDTLRVPVADVDLLERDQTAIVHSLSGAGEVAGMESAASEIRVPVMAEEVVEKRLVVKEEVVVPKEVGPADETDRPRNEGGRRG